MNDQRDFDRAVDRWLDDGTDVTPPAVIDAVLLAARNTPQERDLRLSWRTTPMVRLLYAVAAIAAVAVGVTAIYALGSRVGIAPGPTHPEEPPVDLGIFQPIAGRVVYGSESGIWGLDPASPADPPTTVQLASEAGIPVGWSSDGTKLLVMRRDATGSNGATWDLVIVHADGSETQMTEQPMAMRGAAISPDGSRVAFVGTETSEGDAPWALYSIDAEGGPAEKLVESRFGILEEPTFSPDGTQIAYGDGRGDWGHSVWLVNADGSDAHQILANETIDAASHVYGLAWSPTGDRIALGLEGTIYTFAPDGSGFTRVIADGDMPYWSPDGSQFAYTVACLDDPEGCGLAIADADGSNVVAYGVGASGPWHPAGRAQNHEAPSVQPAASDLVLEFHSWAREGSVVAVYADGRVVWKHDPQVAYLELWLTPEGIEWLRSMAMTTGLFEQDLALGLDLDTGGMEIFRGDQSVMVAWGRTRADLHWTDVQNRFVEATPAQAAELTELEAFVRDPAGWSLPREMYRQAEVTPYVPTHLWVGYDRSRPDLSTLPSPAREVVTRHLEPALSGACEEISIDQAREVADALVQAGVIAAVDDIGLGFEFELTQPRPSLVHLHPALPRASQCR